MKTVVTRQDLVTEQVADELLMYDPQDSSCHCLAPQAAYVWQSLAAGHSIRKILADFRSRFPDAKAKDVVEAALVEFRERKLLVSEKDPAPILPSRRQVLKAIGLSLVATIVASRPASAARVGSFPLNAISALYFAEPATWTGIDGVSCGPAGSPVDAGSQATSSNGVYCSSLITYVNTYFTGAGFTPSNTYCPTDPYYGVVKMFEVIFTCYGGAQQTIFDCETIPFNFPCA